MKLNLAISPCPNDIFIFDAIINKKINLEGLDFEVEYKDIQSLNKDSHHLNYDIIKVSFKALMNNKDYYTLLDSGSALGKNCGPILIKLPDTKLNEKSIIAIPGIDTTANLLLSLAMPKYNNKHEVVFSEIEDGILNKRFDAGLIIHENRFTYQSKGLVKVLDLGEFWETQKQVPIPLGGIVVKKSFPSSLKKKINRIIRRSIDFALNNKKSSSEFIMHHAQEMDDDVVHEHINLYVNKFTRSLGIDGKKAIKELFKSASVDYSGIFLN